MKVRLLSISVGLLRFKILTLPTRQFKFHHSTYSNFAHDFKGKILSILSHDLRSTIANLHSLSSLMLKHRLSPDEFKENLKALNMQALRIIDFFENLLTWTKSNFNKVNVNPSEIDLKNLIGKILTIYESPIHLKGISVRMQIKHGEKLQSERGILEIVIRNLISNAIKFTHDQGRIMVKSVQKNNTVTISVEDTGTGMDAEMIAAVLNNTNAPAFGTRNEKGLGIGLTLCRELLTKIGGDLKIESTLGMGTKISIVLPTKAKP